MAEIEIDAIVGYREMDSRKKRALDNDGGRRNADKKNREILNL